MLLQVLWCGVSIVCCAVFSIVVLLRCGNRSIFLFDRNASPRNAFALVLVDQCVVVVAVAVVALVVGAVASVVVVNTVGTAVVAVAVAAVVAVAVAVVVVVVVDTVALFEGSSCAKSLAGHAPPLIFA